MGNTFLIVLCVLALPTPFFLFYDWRVHQGYINHRKESISCLAMGVLIVLESLSVGAFMALIGFGFGRVITTFSSYRSFGGIIGISSCFLYWLGFCGIVIGFYLALNRIAIEFVSEQEPD